MEYKAIMDRVIVRLCDENHKSTLVSIEKPHKNVGVVLSVGEQVTAIKVGEEIIFHQFDELPLGQKNVVVIREKSILGIIGKQ